MKTWRIPVKKETRGVIEVEAYKLSDAIELARMIPEKKLAIQKPRLNDMPDSKWEIECSGPYGEEYVRQAYNNWQEDEKVELKPVTHAYWLPRDPSNPDCDSYYCSNCKHDYISSIKSLYFKFCPECGAAMENIFEGEVKDE